MKPKHTPGPWFVEHDTDTIRFGPRDGKLNEASKRLPIFVGDEGRANAELIAQAPELLRALETIKGWSRCQCKEIHGDNLNCCVLIAETALKKIESDK